jgi:hypothetical protein
MSKVNGSILPYAVVLFGGVFVGLFLNSRPAVSNDTHAGPQRVAENWVPIDKMHLYLCAFHVAKNNPSFQVEAHHYCSHQGGDLHQCVIYDGRGPAAKILGIEYIITDDAYRKLPAGEKTYWHPHAYEILSGQLIAPDMPKHGDDAFPGFLKTWEKPGTPGPIRPPRCRSANRC